MTITKKIKSMVLAILITSTFLQVQAENLKEEFDSSKLIVMCDFFSQNEVACNNEVNFLKIKNKERSLVSMCFSKYKSVKSFNDCIRYEYNPLMYLKLQRDRNVSTRRIIEIRDEAIKKCSIITETETRFDCVRESYILISKGVEKKNWIENNCLYKNNRIEDVQNCIIKIKKDAIEENNLITRVPNLINALNTWDKKLQNKIKIYFNQIYKTCEDEFSQNNAFECLENKMNHNITTMIEFDFINANCFKYVKYKDFDKCLNKK